jgi:hypothetical protein
MAVLHADIERLIATAGLESTILRPGMIASNVLSWWDLNAWGATMGRPAFVTSAVADILGSARSFRQWAADHAEAFLEGPASHEA